MPIDAISEIDFLLPLSFSLPAAAMRVTGRSVAAPQLVVSATTSHNASPSKADARTDGTHGHLRMCN